MLFERRDTNPSALIGGVAHWNRRQARRHQYTPPSLARDLPRSASASSSVSMASSDSFHPSLNHNCPQFLPKSHKRLQWEKRMHCATVAPFVDKITAGPSPQEREYLHELFAAGAANRREVSHSALKRSIGGHQRPI